MFKNLKKKFAKIALGVLALQLAFMGIGTGATSANAIVSTTAGTVAVQHTNDLGHVGVGENFTNTATFTGDTSAVTGHIGKEYMIFTRSDVAQVTGTDVTVTYNGAVLPTLEVTDPAERAMVFGGVNDANAYLVTWGNFNFDAGTNALFAAGLANSFTTTINTKADYVIKHAIFDQNSGIEVTAADAGQKVVVDTVAPIGTFTTKSPTNLKTIPVMLTFSKPVVDFDLSKLTVVGGVAQNLTSTSAGFTFDIVPNDITKVSDITVDLAAGTVHDALGLGNIAVAQLVINFDPIAPAAVTGLTTLVDATGHVTLSWTNPAAGTFNSIRIYRVGDFVTFLDASATSYTDLTTVPGKTYQYVVTAIDAAGNATDIAPVFVSTPAAIVASAVSDTASYVAPQTKTEEVKASTDTNTKSENNTKDGFPVWGIILLVILAAIGGYLIWNQKPTPAVTPVATKKKNTSNKKK